MAKNSRPRRLNHFNVKGLFGEFNHDLPFSVDENITALIGPNGMGKTACLRLISALFRHGWSTFQSTEFETVTFGFDDGSTITIDKYVDEDGVTDVSDTLGIRICTSIIGEDLEYWAPRPSDVTSLKSRSIDNYVPFLTRTGPKTFVHDYTRQSFTLQEVIENFGERIPEHVKRNLSDPPSGNLAKIISQIDCHLIETQRLLIFTPDEFRRSTGSTLAISRKAQILKEVIGRELAVYASTSQSLDRSFPKRVMEQGTILPSEDLRANLAKLDEVRKGLMDVGILDTEADDALPPFEVINDAIAAVLNIYVKDNQHKLNVLEKLKQRIQLFIELINGRFYPKSVEVNKISGFSVKRNPTTDVPLDKLSSGEQHQLVLFFELLFELNPNALILIDEPELSLHVSWQKQFIPDLMRIIELNKFDVLLATHSPQLIGEWDNIVVELGDVDSQ